MQKKGRKKLIKIYQNLLHPEIGYAIVNLQLNII